MSLVSFLNTTDKGNEISKALSILHLKMHLLGCSFGKVEWPPMKSWADGHLGAVSVLVKSKLLIFQLFLCKIIDVANLEHEKINLQLRIRIPRFLFFLSYNFGILTWNPWFLELESSKLLIWAPFPVKFSSKFVPNLWPFIKDLASWRTSLMSVNNIQSLLHTINTNEVFFTIS